MTGVFLRHPVATWMVFAAFVVMGIYSLPRLQIEAMPEVDLPSLSVVTTWNGASPQAIQRSITLPIEEAVRQVYGVEKITSTSRPGRSTVEVAFRRGTNLDFAQLDVAEQLGSVRRELPTNAQPPVIRPFVPQEFQTEQFFSANIESPLSANELREAAETWILPRILALEGIADATIQGGSRPLLKILLDKRALELYGLGVGEIMSAVMDLDELSAAGVIREDGLEKTITLRESLDVEKIAQAIVARRGDMVFRLNQLAKVTADFEDPLYIVRANGRNVVQLMVEKRSGSNSVGVSQALRRALPEIAAMVPFEVSFFIDTDEGAKLEDKLRELIYRSLAILVLLFLFMAISLRQIKLTAIVVGSIFFTILISLSFFYFLRLSVNFITISGLTVSFGLLLDNSILVLDSIHRRLEILKKSDWGDLCHRAKMELVSRTIQAGTGEVTFPILATTLTTLVAFASFIFLSGRLALYYIPLAVAVATALATSLFVAFGWIPVILMQAWAAPMVRRENDGPRRISSEEGYEKYIEELPNLEKRESFFERLISRLQRFWWLILPPVMALLIWGFVDIYPNKMIKGGFFRMRDQERLFLYLEMPAGTDLQYSSDILWQFEEKLDPIPDGARVQARTFGNQCYLSIEFSDSLLKTEIPTYYRVLLVEQADITGGSSVYISGFSDTPYFKGTFGGSALNSTIRISGYNSRTLSEIAEWTKNVISRNRRVRRARITSGQRFDRNLTEETIIALDRKAMAERGLTVSDLVQQIRLLLDVDIPINMRIEGEEQRVRIAYDGAQEMEYTELAGSLIRTRDGTKVRLDNFISVETIPTQGSIVREDQRYTVYLNWEYVGTDRMRKSTIKKTLAAMDLPYGYHAEEAEREFFTDDEENELNLMAILAAVFIFMVLAALFESVGLPLLVLSSLPMALLGVFVIFWLTRNSFDSSARIGLVLLFGIVVNNAILLVSRYRQETAQSLKARLGGNPCAEAGIFTGTSRQLGGIDLWRLPRKDAVMILKRAVARGTLVRLRSILLTSLTTVMGLLPLLIHFNDAGNQDRDIWENLALSSIGGLLSSTVLLLLTMPPLYYLCVRIGWPIRSFMLKLWRLLFGRRYEVSREPVPERVDPEGT